MAYETMTYEVILKRMMDRVTLMYPNIDTREGSILFNALAPAAIELAIAYTNLDNILSESFVATASREGIYQCYEQMGLDTSGFEATYGEHKGVFDVEVSIGSRWNCDLYNYLVIEYLGEEEGYHTYRMICESLGSTPNSITGDLTAITELPNGLTYAKVTECLVEGEDEADDDTLRASYYEQLSNQGVDGNINQYKEWCSSYDGIGNYKIFPLWNGANTVKVSILSASNKAASEELIADFQNYIDPNSKGMGDGVAPIGAFVTVTTAEEVPISVSADITFKGGNKDTTAINTALTNYFSQIAYNKNTVNYMTLGSVILAVDGVDTIGSLLVNGGTADITLGDEEVPTLGDTNWAVVE